MAKKAKHTKFSPPPSPQGSVADPAAQNPVLQDETRPFPGRDPPRRSSFLEMDPDPNRNNPLSSDAAASGPQHSPQNPLFGVPVRPQSAAAVTPRRATPSDFGDPALAPQRPQRTYPESPVETSQRRVLFGTIPSYTRSTSTPPVGPRAAPWRTPVKKEAAPNEPLHFPSARSYSSMKDVTALYYEPHDGTPSVFRRARALLDRDDLTLSEIIDRGSQPRYALTDA
ncbi:hypothetical protein PLICRDRAFT_181078 [Plicaturopsis crispa FD-325 SS-3]|uniref:Uncharacterized protein n=1 Tax=Plicaturopsis crispa FD-325 SS-3 TaxID=944288 RepID=A0A0C9SPL9_PLICR|nr:hypothetical protein PLICRDRAFT_181078 [Plicaturopsis crispa FD-325 SS-3]